MGWSNDERELGRLKEVECFLIGIDGTIFLGNELIDGSLDFLKVLQKTGKRIVILTNNSSRDARHYKKALKEKGFLIDRAQILTSGRAAAYMLNARHPGERVYVLGNEYLKDELNEAGVKVVNTNFSVMLAGFDTTLTYDKLATFCAGVSEGKPYYATHCEKLCPSEGGSIPNIGAILAFIESSTGRSPDEYAGKPNDNIIRIALEIGGFPASRVAICGDSLQSEIDLGKRNGLQSILVLSGLSDLSDVERSSLQPDLVYARLADISQHL